MKESGARTEGSELNAMSCRVGRKICTDKHEENEHVSRATPSY